MAEFGISMFPTDYAIQPIELALAAEERGFESMFFPEHTHIPASRKTPWPGGAELPKEYWHTHDPFVALGAAAAVTKKLKLGTGVCLVIERDPIVLAKEVASLDMISGGRVIFGIGAGWNVEEMEDHGAVFKRRWKIVKEKILAMRQIWTKEAAEFHGEFVNFDPIGRIPNRCSPVDRRFCSVRNRPRRSSASPNIATDGCRSIFRATTSPPASRRWPKRAKNQAAANFPSRCSASVRTLSTPRSSSTSASTG